MATVSLHRINVDIKPTFLLFFFVLVLGAFLCATLTVEFLTITDALLLPDVICNSSRATLTRG